MNAQLKKDEIKLGDWHLKKEVTIGQIVTLIAVFISGLWWATSVETRLGILNERSMSMIDRVDRGFAKVENTLHRIEDKLDKKADK